MFRSVSVLSILVCLMLSCSKSTDSDQDQPSGDQPPNDTLTAKLELLASYQTPGVCNDVVVDGPYAYVADGDNGVVVLDIATPSQPNLVATYKGLTDVHGVFLVGNTLYAIGRTPEPESALDIIDVSNPSNPIRIGRVDSLAKSAFGPYDIVVQDGYAYIPDINGLMVISVIDAANPYLFGRNFGGDFHSGPLNVTVGNGYAYVTGIPQDSAASSMTMFDLANLPIIRFAGRFHPEGEWYAALGLMFQNNMVYLCGSYRGLYAIDVSNPEAPYLRSAHGTPSETGMGYHVAIQDTLAFTTILPTKTSLQVVDISDPESLSLVVKYTPEVALGKLDVQGEFVYVAEDWPASTDSKLRIFRFTQ